MKTYAGIRTGDGCTVSVEENFGSAALSPRLDLCSHSPTGFEWGYGGSRPAQLSLALLADALADPGLAVKFHQQFKWEVISRLPHEGWRLSEEEIRSKAKER